MHTEKVGLLNEHAYGVAAEAEPESPCHQAVPLNGTADLTVISTPIGHQPESDATLGGAVALPLGMLAKPPNRAASSPTGSPQNCSRIRGSRPYAACKRTSRLRDACAIVSTAVCWTEHLKSNHV